MKKTFLYTVAAMALMASAAQAMEAGDFVVRGRALSVAPSESATISGALTSDVINIDNSIVPELDFTYFFTKNISAELIAAVTPHDVHATSANLDLGDVWLLPPTALLQYHFDTTNNFKPYVGAGVNYTVFFNEDAGSSITDIEYDNSFGPALQLGVDYMLNDHWMLNADIKKIWINTDVSINSGAINADVDINPWVAGIGVGYKF
jgi:outer membrane protein